MAIPLPQPPSDPTTLPPRIATPMVLALCGYTSGTLWRRIKDGKMPRAIDRGAQGYIWRRDEVLLALGLITDPKAAPEHDPWDFDDAAFDKAFARKPLRKATPQTGA